ncbi:MAG: SDR family oxidoreductase [Rhodobacteraceae bacterium]|nr:SDR family oxidoreductase [Paracoccaceae bacterium]
MIDPSEASRAAWTARYPDLAEKTVFISGGATGIGASLVGAFAKQGARVAFVDLNVEAGEALVERLAAEGARAPWFRTCDVTDTSALRAVIDSAQALEGRLDVLVNNAGNDQRHNPETVDEAFWEWCVSINLRHQYFAAQQAFSWMKPQGGGAIINFASVAPRLGIPELSVYNAMKSGVVGMTRSLSKAFAAHGVRVNAITPGAILTPKQLEKWITPEDEARLTGEQHLHRRLVGDDIAPTALFLASAASNAITSQAITVDAGLTA